MTDAEAWRVAWIHEGILIREDFRNHTLATGRLHYLRDILKRTTYPEPYLISRYEWKDDL